jgi:hypothetical protein
VIFVFLDQAPLTFLPGNRIRFLFLAFRIFKHIHLLFQVYYEIGHKDASEVHSMLALYEIGRLKWIELPPPPKGDDLVAHFTPDLVRKWVGFLYKVTELEGMCRAAFTMMDKVRRTRGHQNLLP